MPQQTITIARRGPSVKQPVIHDEIDADVEGPFAIHQTIPTELESWTLTHVPTGYAVLTNELRLPLVAARAELLMGGLDWSFTTPNGVTPAHKRIGKALREKYERGR